MAAGSLVWVRACIRAYIRAPWGPRVTCSPPARLNNRAINVPQDAAWRRPLPRATTNRGPTTRVVIGWGVALGREIDTLAR